MYRDMLGADVSGEQALPEHGVTTVFVNLSNTKLELLHPLGEKSPIAGFLEKNKAGGIHHICIEVRLVGVQDQSNNGGKIPIHSLNPNVEEFKAGVSMYILFDQVNDINAAVADVKSKKIRCLSAEPRIGHYS